MKTFLFLVGLLLFLALIGNMEQADHERERIFKEKNSVIR